MRSEIFAIKIAETLLLDSKSVLIATLEEKHARTLKELDDQHKFQAEVGYVAARQKAIALAMVIDEDCYELGIERSPTGVASWNDDRRPPLYWAGYDHPTDCGTVLMYECRHFFEDDCELMPTLIVVKK